MNLNIFIIIMCMEIIRPLLPSMQIKYKYLLKAFQHTESFVGVAVTTALIGFFRAWLHVPIAIVFGDYLSPAR